MPKVLIVTNDFPPRSGGIQSFVHALAERLPAGQVVVYAPAWKGAAEFDAAAVPRGQAPDLAHCGPSSPGRAGAILAEHGCDTVLFRRVCPRQFAGAGAAGGRAPDRRPDARAGWLGCAARRKSLVATDRCAQQTCWHTWGIQDPAGEALTPAAAGRIRLAPRVTTVIQAGQRQLPSGAIRIAPEGRSSRRAFQDGAAQGPGH
jgi:phosphatidylinositol alpha-1,6-mannosyltransferase